MGVVTTVDIDYGSIFGPFPVASTSMDPTYAIGMLTQDKRHPGPIVEIDPSAYNGTTRGMEWLAYITPARNEDEQNIEAYVKNKDVFYRALRIIRAGEELLVWYSKDFCQLVNIPDVKRMPLSDDEKYICARCGETYEHLFTLRAHMKFKCEVGSTQGHDDKLNLQGSNSFSHRKRRINEPDDIQAKIYVQEQSHSMDKIIHSKEFRDVNSNVSDVSKEKQDLSNSAFRKVEKGETSLQRQDKLSFHDIKGHGEKIDLKYESDKMLPSSYPSKECFVPPELLSSLIVPQSVITSNADIRSKVMDSYAFGMSYPFSIQDSMIRNLESLSPNSRKHLLMTSGLTQSIPFTKSANPMVEKILQTSNMAMLHKPLPALTQSTNWCAKCNTSFRMTSDLVYHMRSHHSKESPNNITKRDDKLKCNICMETFKERHHLTRHMTSHQ